MIDRFSNCMTRSHCAESIGDEFNHLSAGRDSSYRVKMPLLLAYDQG